MASSIDLLHEFETIRTNRRQLLPWWIKVFCWLFIILGVFAFVGLILGLLGSKIDLSIYGFETDEPLSLIGILIIVVLLFKLFTALSLWFEKSYAITLGKIDAISGIVLCLIHMVYPDFINNFHVAFRFELLLLIPYLLKLNKIQNNWTK